MLLGMQGKRGAIVTRIFRAAWLLAAIALMGTAATAQDKQIVVQILDGNTGKPLANQHLTVFGGETPDGVLKKKMHFQLVTNKAGLGSITVPASAKWIQVWADWKTLCQDNPNGKSFSVDEIVSAGLAAPNSCSALVQNASAGQFVVFARPQTLSEKMRQ